VNEAPTDISLSANDIPENVDTSGGQVLVATLSADDPDLNAIVNFTLVGLGNDNNFFLIVGNDLFLQQGVLLDFESQSTLTIMIEAGDDSEAYQESITINVTDVDEAPTAVTLDPNTVSEDADTAIAVLVGTLGTDDPDANQGYDFEIVGGADADSFQIVDGQLFIKEGVILDFETKPELIVNVKADDGVHQVETALTVQVLDANDAPQVADQSLSISENSQVGAVVGSIAANDPDAGQAITFAVLGGSGGGIFDVNFETGEITVLDPAALDFEVSQSFDLLMEVTDDNNPNASSQATITIQITDLDDDPTGVALVGGDGVEEGESNGVLVGQLVPIAPNGGDGSPHTFELVAGTGDTHNSLFQIDGDELSLVSGVVIDYEANPILSIRVKAFNGVAAAESELTVDVANLNEPPTGLELSNDTVVAGDTSSGPLAVGDLTVLDPDEPGVFGDYAFTVEAGGDGDAFQITGSTLEFKQGVDLALKSSYTVSVRADDGEFAAVETFTIHVGSLNEPPFAQPDGKVTQISQAVIINVLANDGDDDGILDPLSVTIVVAPMNGTAEVNADGTVMYMPAAGFEGQDSFQYTVADDEGQVSNAAVVTIQVGPVWTNPFDPMDVDGDGETEILDLVKMVNFLKDHQPFPYQLTASPGPGQMVDINGDGMADIKDLVKLVQFLRDQQQANAEPEGESGEQVAATANSSYFFVMDEEDDAWSHVVDEVAADVANVS
jgi:hypothetical protein